MSITRFFRPLLLVSGCVAFLAAAAQKSAYEAWTPLLKNPGLAAYFSGTFEHLGVRVAETGEALTVHHLGTYFELSKGIDSDKTDFVVTIHEQNVLNMVKHGNDDKIDEAESFQIIKVLFTPLTQAELNNKFLVKKKYLRAAHVGEVIHVTLLDPAQKENYTHTLVHVNDQWIAAPGLAGKPESSLKLTPAQALEFQRNLFAARRQNTTKAWLKFAKWYKTWKKNLPA